MNIKISLTTFFAFAAAGVCASAATPSDVYSDPLIKSQWQWNPLMGGINIADVWADGITGKDVVIGIIDSWVEPFHEDLNVSSYNTATNWQTADLSQGLSYDFRNPGFSPSEDDEQPYTDERHGTACAGMAAAVGGNGVGLVGAAPGATIAGLHTGYSFDGAEYIGFGSDVKYWASGVSISGKYTGEAQIDVKSCSFGSCYGNSTGTDSTLAVTAANNVIYCFAAMNSRGKSDHQYGCPSNSGWSSYGNIASVINVAATNSTGTYASFSNYGANVFIAAPGTSEPSTDRTGEIGYGSGDYANFSGTSAATPLVAGVMALGKEICPDMDVRWAKHALAFSSGHNSEPNIDREGTFHYSWEESTGSWQKNSGGYWFNNNYGFGLIDAVGFVDTARDILYTTTETAFTQTSSGISKTLSSEREGLERSAEFSVSTASALTQNIETVSVRVSFSAAARSALDLTTLKVTLVAPDDVSSIVVQGSVGDDPTTAGEEGISYYTFLTNAFWGSDYSNLGDWRVLVEYQAADSTADTSGWVSVSSVEFTMGDFVFESAENLVAENQTVNVHAVAQDSGTFTVAGTMLLEDSVLVNAGTFVLEETGTLAAYTAGVFGAAKGVKYTQNGGEAEIRGNAAFKRGMTLNGGSLTLYNSVSAGTGMRVDGGTLTIGVASGGSAISVGYALPVYGGTVVLSENSVFSTVLNVYGGNAFMENGSTALARINVGQTTGGVGGRISVAGAVKASSGIYFAGAGTGEFSAGTVFETTEFSVADSASLKFGEGSRIKGSALTLNGGTVSWAGTLAVDGGISVFSGALGSRLGAWAFYSGEITNAGTLTIAEDSKVVFTSDAVFRNNGAGFLNLERNSVLRLETGVNEGLGTLLGSGRLELAQDTAFGGDSSMFAGTLSVSEGCALTVENASSLFIADGATLEISLTGSQDWASVAVGNGGSVFFASGASLLIDFCGAFSEEKLFTVMRWEDGANVSGLDSFVRGENISLYVGGVEYDSSQWNFLTTKNALVLSLDALVVNIITEDQVAILYDSSYIGNFDAHLREFYGRISGDGQVISSADLEMSGDLGGFSGTFSVVSGTTVIGEAAKLGNGDFSVSGNGVLIIAGVRDFANALSGTGELRTAGAVVLSGDAGGFSGDTRVESGSLTISETAKLGSGNFFVGGILNFYGEHAVAGTIVGEGATAVRSGTTVFEKNVGTSLEIDSGAIAKFAGTADGFSGVLTGAGTLTTTQDFVLSGDASDFSGRTEIAAGTFTVLKDVKLGSGDFDVSGTLRLEGTRTFSNSAYGAGTLEITSGTTTFTRELAVNTLVVFSNAAAEFDGVSLMQRETVVDGTLRVNDAPEIATALSGSGTVRIYGDSNFSSDAGAFAGTLMVQRGTLAIAQDATIGDSAKVQLAGTLSLIGERVFNAATSGGGTVRLENGSKISFSKSVGAKNLHVVSGATLNGAASLSYGKNAVLTLDGTLALNVDREEKVSLGGGTAVLTETAKLVLLGKSAEVVSAGAARAESADRVVSKIADGEVIPIFVNGFVQGDIEAFLSTNEDLLNCSEDHVVLYNTSSGLSVQVVRAADEALAKIDVPAGMKSAFLVLAESLGLYNETGFQESIGAVAENDVLTNAILTGSAAARDMAMNILPGNYAAMTVMTIDGFYADARSIVDRLEQLRYDRDIERRMQFYVQVQGSSVENGSGNSAPNFDYYTSGIFAGADYKIDSSAFVGIAVAAEYGEAKIHNGGGKLKMRDFRLTGYFGKTIETFYIDAGAQIGSAGFDIRRKTVWGDPRGDTTVWNGGAFIEAGTLIPLSNTLALSPYVGLGYMHAWTDNFSEKGDSAMWAVDSIDADSLRARVGCSVSWSFELGGAKCRLGAEVAYSHDFLGDEVDIDADYLDTGTHSPTVTAKALPRDVFSVGPTFNVDVSENLGFYAGYEFSAGTESLMSHSANLGVRLRY